MNEIAEELRKRHYQTISGCMLADFEFSCWRTGQRNDFDFIMITLQWILVIFVISGRLSSGEVTGKFIQYFKVIDVNLKGFYYRARICFDA